ncbi:ABC transporter permease [Psychrobacillus sp.]|uniref:ABC transporter permease n=1 Tax=Psychrobacillus sp. TaxID=1871623 RepID=UPI0028BF4542|nr:iron export ABC transporter permease subunit FetB [Psychrobacillus sp.]
MSLVALSFTLLFVIITMLVSVWQKLDLEKDIAIGTIRSAIQLLAVGYVLQFVFKSESILFIVAIICIMIIVAARNAAQRAKGLNGIEWKVIISIVTMVVLMMGLLLSLQIIEATPQYIIPLSGMTIGNAMVACGLFLTQLKREVEASKGEIETLLSLGATARQAVQEVLKRSVKFSLIPTIDSMKTVGLVQLPGMMTGMIVAGADPVEAVRYQLLIIFVFTCSSAITSMILSSLCYKSLFTKDFQLKQW